MVHVGYVEKALNIFVYFTAKNIKTQYVVKLSQENSFHIVSSILMVCE